MARQVRYARVPTGTETCPFCVMLASRGFVYLSERAARHAHPGCDCRVVPGFAGETEVEGYDLDGLYRQYIKDLGEGRLNLGGVGRYSGREPIRGIAHFEGYKDFSDFVKSAEDIEDLQLRCAVVEEEWRKARLPDKYYGQLRQTVMNKRSELLNDAYYEKPRAELEEHERRGVDLLLRNGIVPTVKREDPRAKANIDFEIAGKLWEMKNVSNAESSVSNQVKRARIKWFKLGIGEPMRCVFTCEGCSDGFGAVCAALEKRRRVGEEFVVLSSTGELAKLP